ncbi:hypothetical protein DRQ53_05655 [bacterium]|nr:MAG: hypothetical protein DRQ32_01125 [bacterium]RKZ16702.1 MAG: hypothetical protein DRQ53_05655 [bacterium]
MSEFHVFQAREVFDLLTPEERERLAAWESNRDNASQCREEFLAMLRASFDQEHVHVDEDLVVEVLDGQSTPDERRRLLEHLGECRDCRFVASVTLAGRSAPAPRRRFSPSRRAVIGVSVAAGLTLLAWLGPRAVPDPGRHTQWSGRAIVAEPIYLESIRAEGPTQISRTSSRDGVAVVMIEARTSGSHVRWLVRRSGKNEALLDGELPLHDTRARIREFAFRFDLEAPALAANSVYQLVLFDEQNDIPIDIWTFELAP